MSTGGAESLSGIHGGTPPLTGPSAVEVMSSVRRGSWPPYGQTGASIRSDGCCEFIKLCLMPSSSSTPSFIKVFVFVYIFTHTHTHTHTPNFTSYGGMSFAGFQWLNENALPLYMSNDITEVMVGNNLPATEES